MKLIKTAIQGCYEIIPNVFEDDRGRFVKPYHMDDFKKLGIDLKIVEEYFTVSKKNVLRGMHFQTPPMAVDKLATCVQGEAFDAVIDLRKNSETYLKTYSTKLNATIGNMLYIPKGLAHGFVSFTDDTLMLYMCSGGYSPDNDYGIKWDTLGIEWPIVNPIISERDNNLISLDEFESPF